MDEIVFFLEEYSAEVMLEGFLPKLLPKQVQYRCIVFEGKQDLDGQIVKRMRGYRVPNTRFVVLRDQDLGDCKIIKKELAKKCSEAGHPNSLIRIACHELESWYLADLSAVEKGLGLSNLARKYQNKKPFSLPDSSHRPAQMLKKIASSYQKIGGSRSIGPHLNPKNKRSRSFAVFVEGLKKLCSSSLDQ